MLGWRQEIAKQTNKKIKTPEVVEERQLVGRVDVTWSDLEHSTKEYFHPDGSRVVQHAKNVYNYLHVHGGELLRDGRSMLAEVQWKVLADLPRPLFKTNYVCVETSDECAEYNFLANLPEMNVIPVERLKGKAESNIAECASFQKKGPICC